jgi:hypothetical protein
MAGFATIPGRVQGGNMRFIIILFAFAMLLFLPGLSPADSVKECQKKCSDEMAESAKNCPPAGKDTAKERSQCVKDIQSSLKDCNEACVKFSSWEAPKDEAAEEPKDAVEEKPIDAQPIAPPDAPK